MGAFYSRETIEQQASALLARYSAETGTPLCLPVSAEHILDTALANELSSVLWDVLPETSGLAVFGCLHQGAQTIVLNESRRDLLLDTPGLLNTTIAHEIGHWQLHARRPPEGQVVLPGFDAVDLNTAATEPDYWDEKNAHRFMASLLMPRDLLVPRALAAELSHWRGLYRLREQLDVTITALKIRLEELGFAYVDKKGAFHRSRAESVGQLRVIK